MARGGQYLHRATDEYRAAIRRKLRAYHVHVQLGCIDEGLLQHLAINHTAEVWLRFRSWLLTMNPAMPPSELIAANTLRSNLPAFLAVTTLALTSRKSWTNIAAMTHPLMRSRWRHGQDEGELSTV